MNFIIGSVSINYLFYFESICQAVIILSANLPHKHKIIIAGNHELSFDATFKHPFEREKEMPCLGISRNKIYEAFQSSNIKDQLTSCTYLQVNFHNKCICKILYSSYTYFI